MLEARSVPETRSPSAHGWFLLFVVLGCASQTPPQGPASVAEPAETVESVPPRSLGLVLGRGDEADQWLLQGERAYFAGELDRAEAAFARARVLLPRHPAPVVGLALVELERSKSGLEFGSRSNDPALLPLVSALEAANEDPEFGPMWLVRGRLLLLLGDATQARLALEAAVASTPEDSSAHSALGIACLAEGDLVGAVSGSQRAVDLNPNSAALWTNLGAVLMMSEQPEKAREAYRRAIELAPDSARARSDLGTTLIALGQARAALGELEEAHRLAPERATVMNNLGYAFQTLGDFERAESWYQKALAADPALGSAWVNLGVLFAKQRRFDEARTAFEQALRLDPEDPRALVNLEELGREQAGVSAEP